MVISSVPARQCLPERPARLDVRCMAGQQTTKVIFSLPRRLKATQKMHMVGNTDSLGRWDESQRLTLEKLSNDCWFTEVDVAPGQRLEYKFFTQKEDLSLIWQDAETFFIDIPPGTGGAELVITDSWQGENRAMSWQGLTNPREDEVEELPTGPPIAPKSAMDSKTSAITAAKPNMLGSLNGSQPKNEVITVNGTESGSKMANFKTESTDSENKISNGVQAKRDTVIPKADMMENRSSSVESQPGKTTALLKADLVEAPNKTVEAPKKTVEPAVPKSSASVESPVVKGKGQELDSMSFKDLKMLLRGLGLPFKRKKAEVIQDIRQFQNTRR